MNAGDPKSAPSSRARLVLASLALLVLCPCLGLLASGGYLWARGQAAFSRWQSLGAPPEHAADILAGDTSVVYVAAGAGKVYACAHHGKKPPAYGWSEAAYPLEVDPEIKTDQRLFDKDPKPPPGVVVDSLIVTRWFAEAAEETRYLLMQDGSVWMWRYDVGSYLALFMWIAGPLAGLALGVLAVIALWLRAGVRAHNLQRSRN